MYTAKVIEDVPTKPGCWNYQKIGIFDKDIQVGEYIRNYSHFYHTFYSFEQNCKWYALYSKDYTSTRLMSLPDCLDIGGEERNTWGFCPVDYYVPKYKIWTVKGLTQEELIKERIPEQNWSWVSKEQKYKLYEEELEDDDSVEEIKNDPFIYEPYGFVSGCIWGDDTSWKIQFLDLSEVSKGVLKRDERFGYVEQPSKLRLKESVELSEGHLILNIRKHYHLDDKGTITQTFD
jgi:hypothetical protein